ncbi:hypothetical protein ABIF50_003202 [Bradyrhizobium diazoefficiens]
MPMTRPSGNHESLESKIPKRKKPRPHPPAFLQNRILYRDNFCLSLRPICILHGRLIKARVKTFEKAYFPQVPQIARLAIRTSDFIRKGKRLGDPVYLDSAWDLVHDSKLPASITEHPHFKSVYGYVASALQPPKLQEARAAFKFVLGTRFPPPIEHLRCWFFAERNSGIGFTQCLEICDFVVSGRSYERAQKVQFSAYKALLLNHQGRENAFDNPWRRRTRTSRLWHCTVELWRNLGDDGVRKAAYRGG